MLQGMKKQDIAEETFNSGYNCCQAVVSAFHDELGLDGERAFKMASGFGGGMRRAEVCGAVTGGLMMLGLKYGQALDGPKEDMDRAKKLTLEFEKRFEQEFDSILCRDILGYDLTKEDEHAIIVEKNLTKIICPKAVKTAVRILEEMGVTG
jgi:C_GCAxxG_C_C family probable redox protein